MANELYCTVDEINAHLPPNKAQIKDSEDDLLQTEAYRLIRAKVGGTFTAATLAAWNAPTTPAHVPEIIRSISGMIQAAKWYAELYAEDSDEDAEYAMNLWNQAMALLQGIVDGTIVVLDPDTGEPIGDVGLLTASSFWPNDSNPKFTMDKEFA